MATTSIRQNHDKSTPLLWEPITIGKILAISWLNIPLNRTDFAPSGTFLKKSVDHFSLGNKSVLGKTMIIIGLHRNFVESGRD